MLDDELQRCRAVPFADLRSIRRPDRLGERIDATKENCVEALGAASEDEFRMGTADDPLFEHRERIVE